MSKPKSKIIQILLKRIMKIYILIIAIMLTFVLALILPAFFRTNTNELLSRIEIIKDHYSTLTDNATDTIKLLCSSKDFRQLMNTYLDDSSEKNVAEINLYLSTIQSSNDNIMFILMDDLKDGIFSSIKSYKEELTGLVQSNTYYQKLYRSNSIYYSTIITDEIEYPFSYVAQKVTVNQKEYIITVCINITKFTKIVDIVSSDSLDKVYIYNKNQELVYSVSGTMLEQKKQVFEKMTSTKGWFFLKHLFYYYTKDITKNQYVVVCLTVWDFFGYYRLILIGLFLLFLIPVFIYYYLLVSNYNKILNPINTLVRQMTEYEFGNEFPKILRTNDEIQNLSVQFNIMLRRIQKQAQELTKKERENAINIYKLLTTQIPPHFICNTLNIINILAREQNTTDIVLVNTALTRLLREQLNTQICPCRTIQEEIAFLNEYIAIMNVRYHNSIIISYELDESIENEKIIRNLLQPLAENAIVHGFFNDRGIKSGDISIVIYPSQGKIVIEVSDSGNGIESERLKMLKESCFDINQDFEKDVHIGLSNIYQRLHYLYHNEFEFDIQSSPGYGTTVILVLPFIKDEQKNLLRMTEKEL